MSAPVLSARALRKTYRSGNRELEVFHDVDFHINAGESVSIRGESGSGKSTLLNLLAALDNADAGTLSWDGFPKIDNAARGRFLGIIFQAFYLIPELNALENILMARRIAGNADNAARSRAAELLARVGLKDRGHHLPSQLSGGERQRVAVARALMNSPRLVLADEPTGNLDEKTADSVMDLLLGICAETNTALVLVTHNPLYAQRTAREYFLHEGTLRSVR
ncbi:ABC transporter ATP-binding protein [Ereboglobus luteus]|uniref:ABC transporter n=1 Tax=Ereboglobus luteus TaxID=1796921 RepID=A0A2U8E1J7_9BACT|nr:ABC transporter ATP-binding protein [Ereboglobus luteus]AWI08711.1 ABC transporter [Ereboglobus luteus]